MTVLLLVASLGVGAPEAAATLARPAQAVAAAPRGSSKAAAAVSFVLLVIAGGLFYRRLGERADAAEAEALLDAEFERLERADAEARPEKSRSP